MYRLASIKEKAVLLSLGVQLSESSEESTSESETDDEGCSGGEQETAIDFSQQLHSDDSKHHDNLQEHESQANKEDNQQEHQAGFRDNYELPLGKQRSTTGEIYMNTNQLLDMLRACKLNWMPFVELLKTEIPSVTSEALDQLLLDFASTSVPGFKRK